MTETIGADPERILKEFRKLWLDLAKQDPNGVLRACAMTLIVVADEARDPQAIGENIAALMHEHPSRAIVIRVRQCPEQLLEARVLAQCWMPFGRRQQICCEQVEIICSPASLADVANVVRALVVPDLPSILFSPSETLWFLPQFESLLPLAGKLVVDSCGMPDSTRVLGFLTALRGKVQRRADLVWSRLTPWREAVAQVFDTPSRRRSVYDLSEVRILYKADEEPSSVYYLAGWFMHVLGAGVKLKIARGVGPEFASIAHVALSGQGLEASIDVVDRCTVETRINDGEPQVTVFPQATDYYALRQELSVAGQDAVFEDCLGLGHLMRSGG